MNILSAESVSKAFSDVWLFEEITFGMSQGDKIALVGINGAGKSTFLKILAGIINPDEGEVNYRKGLSVYYLQQDPKFPEGGTVREAIFDDRNEVLETALEYEYMLPKAAEKPEEFQLLMEKMDRLGAWDVEAQIRETLGKLGIHDLTQPVSSLSGGQRKRVALAKMLLSEPDLLILDEPTNHLDLEIIEWLEQRLSTHNTGLLVVTHDRYFLDKVTNKIIELDGGKLHQYNGNYAYYLENKTERQEQEAKAVDKARKMMKQELEWIRRMPKARGTKAKYRVENFGELKKKAQSKRTDEGIIIDADSSRQGKKILELENIYKAYDGKVMVDHFTYFFRRSERIGIVGKNGVGKTTFLQLITEQDRPDSGKIRKGKNTVFGYYTQHALDFKETQRVIDIVKEVAEVIKTAGGSTITASQLLTHFQFPPKDQYKYVSKLSGGEKRRLQLLRVLMANPNFLVLDEPTNDLDIVTLNILEDFLANFGGCLIIVSHDRYFMDRLVDHLFVFEGDGKIKDFPGNYSDYKIYKKELDQKLKAEAKERKAEEKNIAQKAKKDKPKTKLSFKEKKEFESLETELAELEERKTELTELMGGAETDFTKIQAWAEEIEQINEQLEEKEMRWLELSEFDS